MLGHHFLICVEVATVDEIFLVARNWRFSFRGDPLSSIAKSILPFLALH
jgi:hypothetical protein